MNVLLPHLAGVVVEHSATPRSASPAKSRAEHTMWEHVLGEQACGRTPTGAELDRIAGTNNYGRTVLRRWRAQGHIPSDPDIRNEHSVPT